MACGVELTEPIARTPVSVEAPGVQTGASDALPDQAVDRDGDGVSNATDCDDADPAVFPGADEACDGRDNDCDGAIDEDAGPRWYRDADGDGHGAPDGSVVSCAAPSGHVSAGTDCDDADPAVSPDAVEVCDDDNIDEDCSGVAEDATVGTSTFFRDADGDTYGLPDDTVDGCDQPDGYARVPGDCDDTDPAVSPDGVEVCDDDNRDEDCSGAADDADPWAIGQATWYRDQDGDGFGDASHTERACDPSPTRAVLPTDCDDADGQTFPGAPEVCDGVSNDCDATTWPGDAGLVSGVDASGVWTDWTATLAAGAPTSPAAIALTDTVLMVCEGDWYASVVLTGDGGLQGVGDPEHVVLDGGRLGRVFSAATDDATVTLTGLTLQRGVADADSGGVASITGASTVVIDGVTLLDGHAAEGGALYLSRIADVTLRDVVVADSRATNGFGGGALIHAVSLLRLVRVTIDGNLNSSAYGGGGLATKKVLVTTGEQLTITDNAGSGVGAGWAIEGGSSTIEDIVVVGNTGDRSGGGIDASGDLSIDGGLIADNLGTYGGGVRSHEGVFTATDVVFDGNRSLAHGAAVHVAVEGDTRLVDCAVTANDAPSRKSALNNNGVLSLSGVTFSDNETHDVRSGLTYDYGADPVTALCGTAGCE